LSTHVTSDTNGTPFAYVCIGCLSHLIKKKMFLKGIIPLLSNSYVS